MFAILLIIQFVGQICTFNPNIGLSNPSLSVYFLGSENDLDWFGIQPFIVFLQVTLSFLDDDGFSDMYYFCNEKRIH